MKTNPRPILAGVKVIDLSTFLSGPYATQILGDLGAEIIKVEPPAGGDPTRNIPPHFVYGDSAYFHSINRSKKSVVLDLKMAEGRDLLLKLIATADILLENFRPGVMKRLGLTEEAIQRANPKLIWCSLTGFGGEGPYRDYPAYDMIVQALSGGMSMTGEPDGGSVRAGVPIGDLAAGLFSVIGVLAALNERHVTGKGRRIDVAMLDCQLSMLSYQAQYYLVSGQVPGRQGARHDSFPTYRSFMCGDGKEVVVTANNERMWSSMCDVLGCPELVDDPRFRDNAERLRNKQALWELLEARFLEQQSQDVFLRLMKAGVPAAPINTVAQAMEDPQIAEREMLVDVKNEDGRALRMVSNPIRVDGASAVGTSLPPRLGENTVEVLRDQLGMTDDDIARVRASGCIGGKVGEKKPAPASAKVRSGDAL